MKTTEELFLAWLDTANNGERLWSAPRPWTAEHTKLASEFAEWFAQRSVNSILGEALNSGRGVYKP